MMKLVVLLMAINKLMLLFNSSFKNEELMLSKRFDSSYERDTVEIELYYEFSKNLSTVADDKFKSSYFVSIDPITNSVCYECGVYFYSIDKFRCSNAFYNKNEDIYWKIRSYSIDTVFADSINKDAGFFINKKQIVNLNNEKKDVITYRYKKVKLIIVVINLGEMPLTVINPSSEVMFDVKSLRQNIKLRKTISFFFVENIINYSM